MEHEEEKRDSNAQTDHLLKLCNLILQSDSLDKTNALQVQKLYYELESHYIEENMKLQRRIWQLDKELEIIELNKKHETSLSIFSEELVNHGKKMETLWGQLEAIEARIDTLEHTKRR